ncbi:MAG: OmpH family outer membrane protein [Pirellulaceae bacterium]|nr:OmpH family outer membrane protein [Planctomycetales bacterium]
MKTAIHFLAAIVMATLCSNVAVAQQNQGGIVAVVDIAKVFEAHAGHKAKMLQIEEEVKAFEADFKTQRQSLNTQIQALQALVGQPAYKEEEAKLARMDADLTIQANQKRAEIINREAQVYYETYTDVYATVARLAQSYNITLVINYDSAEIDPTNRDSIIKGVNRNVVFQRDLDLTELVIQQINAAGN